MNKPKSFGLIAFFSIIMDGRDSVVTPIINDNTTPNLAPLASSAYTSTTHSAMPNFISVIVLCGMVRMLLSPVGPLNKVLGISTNWMTMPSAFRTIYIASGIWQTAGWASIMYTAALANASKELEEAAIMDGANLLQQIWYVELPAIKNIIVIQFILQAGNIMSIGFEKAYALQTDMNLPASEILSTYVYRIGLLNGDYGYSTAVGLFNSVVNVILLIFVNWVVKKLNDGEGL